MDDDERRRSFFVGFVSSLAAGLITATIIRNLTKVPQVPYLPAPGEAEQTSYEVGWTPD